LFSIENFIAVLFSIENFTASSEKILLDLAANQRKWQHCQTVSNSVRPLSWR